MAIADDISERITRADQIATAAIAATAGLNDLFEDMDSIRAPILTPQNISVTIPPVTLSDQPTVPDESRLASAVTALGSIPSEIVEINERKALLDAAMTAFDSTVAEVESRIPAITALSAAIVIPQAEDLQFTEGDFRAGNSLDAVLKAVIESEIANGGEGYSDETETAVYDLGSEASEVVRQEAIDTALGNAAGTGFCMPQGHHVEAVRKINEQYRADSEKRSSDAMLLQTKLSVENKWRALNAGISYNQIMFAYFDAKAQRALDAAIAVIALKLTAIKYRTDIARQALDIGKASNKAVMDRTRIVIERYTADLLIYRKQLEGLLSLAKNYIVQYRENGQVYATQVSAAADKSRLDQAENNLSREAQKINIMAGITAAKELLSSFVSTSKLRLGAATSGAKMQKAIAMSTINSLGTVASRIKAGEFLVSE